MVGDLHAPNFSLYILPIEEKVLAICFCFECKSDFLCHSLADGLLARLPIGPKALSERPKGYPAIHRPCIHVRIAELAS